jgi:hypothetical protein
MKFDGKLILDTNLVQIYHTGAEYKMYIAMSEGGIVEHEPFPGNLQGLVASMQVATDILAGKFFLRTVAKEKGEMPKIERQTLKISGPGRTGGSF